jgi:hypothetical protein
MLGEEYRSLSCSLCSFLLSPVNSFLLGPCILLSLCSPSLWVTKFHSHTKQQAKFYCTWYRSQSIELKMLWKALPRTAQILMSVFWLSQTS